MGTNFYWKFENPYADCVSDVVERGDLLYDTLRGAVAGDVSVDVMRDVLRRCDVNGSCLVTLPSGVEIECAPDLDMDEPTIHIGKRSAAGLYCFDCGLSLCESGEDGVHYSESVWSDVCLRCGKGQAEESSSSMEVELGFADPAKAYKTGVKSCSSFGWAQDPDMVRRICKGNDSPIIVDEYGREMTGVEFLEMLDYNCPIQHTKHLGVWFC